MRSIRTRLIFSHFIVAFFTVTILQTVLWVGIKNYYYKSVEDTLKEQAQISSGFYNKYLTAQQIEKTSNDLIENFASNTNAEIQIIYKDNKLLADSIGVTPGTKISYSDVEEALSGKISTWKGRIDYSKENAMSVSAPLKSGKEIVGVIRVVTSLEIVNSLLKKIFIFLIINWILVMLITMVVSVIISLTITGPLNQVTNVAKQMASGNFSIKAKKRYNDEVGSMADTLNYMSEEILKNEKLKNDFISSVSHELRTPLTSIKGWALTLKLKQFTDPVKREEGLDIIVEESERLTDLVEELLDFSKFQSGRITLNIEEINIGEILLSVLKQMQPRAERNSVFLQNHIEQIPSIKADKNRLRQVFINIIDNALKFTPYGGRVDVTATLINNEVIILIHDTGCGIKAEDISNVTKKFFKGDGRKSGSGIGLAICHEIIKLHGGRLRVESNFGEGTTIGIYLSK